MCLVVEAIVSGSPKWDAPSVSVCVPAHLTHGQAVLVVRQILTELGTPQPQESTMEVVCFCGEPVRIAGALPSRRLPYIPRQRTGALMEAAHGA